MEEAKPQILLWMVPECPLRITVLANVINEIRILAVEAFYSVPRGGVEIGGVFFGVRESDAVHIRAHRPIACQYATGPSFTLSVNDQISLSGLLEQASADPDLAGMVPLGWYHSHTRSEIFLSPADLQLYSEFFPERWQIAMVLRPTNLQPTRAGFFFRDRLGAVKSDAPVREFKLEAPDFGLVALEQDPSRETLPGDQLDRPVPPTPDRPASLPAVAPAAFAAVPAPAPARMLKLVPPPSQTVVEPAAKPEPATLAPVVDGAQADSLPVVAAPVAADVALPGFLSSDAPPKKRNLKWLWAVVAVLLLCAAGGVGFLKWGRLVKSAGLGLETYDINGAFLIRWDRESSAIRSATHATLEIQDGSENTPISLNRAELLLGGYGYIRRTGQVSVYFKVEGSAPAEEYSNFTAEQSLGSKTGSTSGAESLMSQSVAEKEHLKTELINESMQTLELRREITSLRRQLADERAKNGTPPAR